MTTSFVPFWFWLLSWLLHDCHAPDVMIADDSNNFAQEIYCGNRVQIKHRTSNLCLTIMSKNDEIGLKQCFEIDQNQHWIIDCCDSYLLRCEENNPIKKIGDQIQYDCYFRLRHAMKSDLCISTGNQWQSGYAPHHVFLEKCQGSYLDIDDSGESEYKMLRDKFCTHAWHKKNTNLLASHYVQLISLGQSTGCLGYDKDLLQGFSCNTGLEHNHKFQFRFIVLDL